MKKRSYQGRYLAQTPAAPDKGRRGKKRFPVRMIALVLFLTVLVAGGSGMGVYMLHIGAAQRDFRELADQLDTTPQAGDLGALVQKDPVQTQEDAQQPQPPAQQKPQLPVLQKYKSLYDQNEEFFGWVTIEDTRIDYPVMHSPEDPEKYLHANFSGEFSYPGTPLMDGSCTPDSVNYIVYGHNMQSGGMFHDLIKYEVKNFWQQHPTIRFDTVWEEGEYEVVAAFYDRVYYKRETDVFKFYQFIDPEDQEEFDYGVQQLIDKSLYDTGVVPQYGDRLLTLVTCAYHTDNGRFVVVARKITE